MRRQLVVHPLLLALFPILGLYSANVAEVSPSEVLIPVMVTLGATTALLALGWLLFRDVRKAGLLASVVVVLVFSLGHVVNFLMAGDPNAADVLWNQASDTLALLLLLVWIVIGGSSTYLVWRMRGGLHNVTTILNVVGAVLVIVPTMNIAVREMGGASRDMTAPSELEITLSPPEIMPDIYYIILDRYASSSTLEESYGFDNRDFENYLADKGFYVASQSRANYWATKHSLASSLNMSYLDQLAAEVGEDCTDHGPLNRMLQDHTVWRLLASVGYQYIHFGDWWEPTRQNRNADVNVNYRGRLSEFTTLLLGTTAIEPVGGLFGLWGEPRKTHWERERYKFERLAEVPEIEEPTFVFAHFILPHTPYVFNRDGSFLEPSDATARSIKSQYVDQVVATNAMVMSLIDRLLADSDSAAVVVIQADEGPVPGGVEWPQWNADGANDEELREKLGILNAYYLPGVDSGILYPSVSPVNSFRLVFNVCFGTHLELLPDRSYSYDLGQAPYGFLDITERLA